MNKKIAGLTDTHSHLSYLTESGIDSACLDMLVADGFGFMLDIGTAPGDLPARISRLSQYPNVRFACGIWPHAELLASRHSAVAQIEAEIKAAPPGLVVAIGECGFDRRENPQAPHEERELLELQLELARCLNLPLIIHSREAPAETIETLSRYPTVRTVIHCFSYSPAEAKIFLDMGCSISFAGNLTYKNAQNLRDTLPLIPKNRLLLETDCPYLAPVPHRGSPCHPGLILETYNTAAAILAIDLEALKCCIAENARALFNGQ